MNHLFVPLRCTYYLDPKISKCGEASEVLYVRALGLAKNLLSDGYLTRSQVLFLGLDEIDERIKRLVESGLWSEAVDGWQIVAWLKHNKSAEQIETETASKREAGKAGGKRSGETRRKQGASSKHEAPTEAPASSKREAPASSKREAPREPRVQSESESETETATAPPSAGGNKPPPSAHQHWMEKATLMWRDICPEDVSGPGAYLAGLKKLYGAKAVQLSLEHMLGAGWKPNGTTEENQVKAYRSYLAKCAQGKRNDAAS